LGQSGAILFN